MTVLLNNSIVLLSVVVRFLSLQYGAFSPIIQSKENVMAEDKITNVMKGTAYGCGAGAAFMWGCLFLLSGPLIPVIAMGGCLASPVIGGIIGANMEAKED